MHCSGHSSFPKQMSTLSGGSDSKVPSHLSFNMSMWETSVLRNKVQLHSHRERQLPPPCCLTPAPAGQSAPVVRPAASAHETLFSELWPGHHHLLEAQHPGWNASVRAPKIDPLVTDLEQHCFEKADATRGVAPSCAHTPLLRPCSLLIEVTQPSL